MSFDINRFTGARLVHRTVDIEVKELASFFGSGAAPVFKVKGLSGEEFYGVKEAVQRRVDVQAIASTVLGGSGADIAAAIEELYGAVPDEYARRVEILVRGCVEPEIDRISAVKLITHFPTSAHAISEAILRATGEGSLPGE